MRLDEVDEVDEEKMGRALGLCRRAPSIFQCTAASCRLEHFTFLVFRPSTQRKQVLPTCLRCVLGNVLTD
jgi:hypothetical protein